MTSPGSCARSGDVRPVAGSDPRRGARPGLGTALCRLRQSPRLSDPRGRLRRLLASRSEAHAAFAMKHWVGRGPLPNLKGCVMVLVDDVATTGATLEACAQVLLSAGAREVRALTAAAASPAARQRPRQRRPEDARRPLVASLGRPPGARSSLGPRPGARDLVRSDRDP